MALRLSVSCDDAVLCASLAYWVFDTYSDLSEFNGCQRPVHSWLLVSCLFVLGSRLISIVGAAANHKEDEGENGFVLNLRNRNALQRYLANVTVFIVLPLFAIWTLIGTYWIVESKWMSTEDAPCSPSFLTSGFILAWLLLNYVWISIHAWAALQLLRLELRARSAEAELRVLANDDVRARRDHVNESTDYASLPHPDADRLSLAEILMLPGVRRVSEAPEESGAPCAECSICLQSLEPREEIRELCSCRHTFHRGCIDLWLLRCSECPLCKRSVRD